MRNDISHVFDDGGTGCLAALVIESCDATHMLELSARISPLQFGDYKILIVVCHLRVKRQGQAQTVREVSVRESLGSQIVLLSIKTL